MWLLVTAGRKFPRQILDANPYIYYDHARIGVSRPCNTVFQTFPDEPFYGFIADDMSPQTDRWWHFLGQAAGNRNIAFGDEQTGVPHDRVGSCFAIGGDLVRAAGWWMPPWRSQRGVDGVWTRFGRKYDLLRYCPAVITRNLVPYGPNPDVPFDDIHALSQSRQVPPDKKEEAAFHQRMEPFLCGKSC